MSSDPRSVSGQPAHTVPVLIAVLGENIDRLICVVLSSEGYEATIAVYGQDALDRLVPATRAHLVIVDTWYMVRYGDALCDFLADPVRRAPHRVVMVCGVGQLGSLVARDRPDDVLLLPFGVDDLLTTVERVERLMSAQPDQSLGFTIDM